MAALGFRMKLAKIMPNPAMESLICDLVQVSISRALHEQEKRLEGGLTRMQLFLGTPLSTLWFAIANVLSEFILHDLCVM